MNRRQANSGFTLVELIVSVALAVILLLGIAAVFRMSSDTIGAGETLAAINRQTRGAQLHLQQDFARLVKDAPIFIISSRPANNGNGNFNNRADLSSDRDNNPMTFYEAAANAETAMPPISFYNDRNHRVDIIGFPARGSPTRHTGDDVAFASTTHAVDYWCWYGHTVQYYDNKPDPRTGQNVTYREPGVGNVGEPNSFAANWALGRVTMLFRDANLSYTGSNIPAERYLERNVPYLNFPNSVIRAPDLSPLSKPNRPAGVTGTYARRGVNNNEPDYSIDMSRFDLLGCTLEQLRQDVQDLRRAVAQVDMGGGKFGMPDNLDYDMDWWVNLDYRFQANTVLTKPVTSEQMARLSPIMVQGCTQFMVEYAGDFVSQRASDGAVIGLEPDGIIDYYYLTPGNNQDQRMRIRWYGLPRDVEGFDASGNPTGKPDGKINYFDVIPLRDIRLPFANAQFDAKVPPLPPDGNRDYFDAAPFEREVPAYQTDYSTVIDKAKFRYTCVWVNSAPSMVRIVMKVDDPNNRLKDGPYSEFILESK